MQNESPVKELLYPVSESDAKLDPVTPEKPIVEPESKPLPVTKASPIPPGHIRLVRKTVDEQGNIITPIVGVTVNRGKRPTYVVIPNAKTVIVPLDVAVKAMATGAFTEHPSNKAKLKR